jgi:hypothetical protein
MSEPADERAGDGAGRPGRNVAALKLVDWLGLAAAPTFALMALLTAVLGGGDMGMICGSPPAPFFVGGMVPMYLLMSAFHSAPWLKRIAHRKADTPS